VLNKSLATLTKNLPGIATLYINLLECFIQVLAELFQIII